MTVSPVEHSTQQVTVVFHSDGSTWKLIPFSHISSDGQGPLRPLTPKEEKKCRVVAQRPPHPLRKRQRVSSALLASSMVLRRKVCLGAAVADFYVPEYFLEHFLRSCELARHMATGRTTWLRVCQSGFPTSWKFHGITKKAQGISWESELVRWCARMHQSGFPGNAMRFPGNYVKNVPEKNLEQKIRYGGT